MSAITAAIHLTRWGDPATIEHVENPNRVAVCYADGAHWASIFIDDLEQGRQLLDAVGAAVAHLEATAGEEVAQ
jgi:hypothetical protein